MAQISFSFSGGFWPISFPLFHGTARSLAFETVLVAAYMNGSFLVERSPILNVDQGRLSTRSRQSRLRKADIKRPGDGAHSTDGSIGLGQSLYVDCHRRLN